MGKILIINGADFSVNAIEQVGENIAGLIPVVRGYNRGVNYADLNRAGTTAAFDLYDYIQEGYVRISVIPVSGMTYVGYISSTNVPSSVTDLNSVNIYDGGAIGMGWTSVAGGTSIPAGYRYLQLGFKRVDEEDFSNVNYIADSFVVLELHKS